MHVEIPKVLLALRDHTIDTYLEDEEYIEEKYLCDIHLPTGKIIANDPVCMYEFPVLSNTLLPGKYPVYIYIHHIQTDQRVAFAEIRIQDTLPQYYEVAGNYGVDSATGCYMDASLAEVYKDYSKEQVESSSQTLSTLLEETYTHTYSTCNYTLDTANIVAFSTGYGDGEYTCYLGYDSNQKICTLITYFDTLEEIEEVEAIQISEEEKQRMICKYKLER
ncbi:MAG: DUF4241 domain-containing protein [Erysipelotrichales bacterium]|nr:DUF4241 domain-containing protein [Erysipelotrichales bacterium]